MVSLYGVLAAIVLLHLHTVSTTPTSSFELLQELRQIRIELCASHIDRNKTTSALDQFHKISGDDQVKDLVKYYIEFYEDNLDNLLQFLFILKLDVQQIGYQTIFELWETNNCEIFSVLKIYKFVNKNYSKNDVKKLNEQVETVTINAVVGLNLLELINYTNDNITGPSFIEFLPLVIHRIYNSNPNRTVELFGFVDQVKDITNKIKLLHILLKEVVPKRNIRHLSLILHRFKSIKSEINSRHDVSCKEYCGIKSMEKNFPDYFKPYLSDKTIWLIKNLYINEVLLWYSADQFNFDLPYTANERDYMMERAAWYVTGTFFDEYSTIESFKHGMLLVDRCIHNDTFLRLNIPEKNSIMSLWTVETDNEVSFVRFKNTATGEYLSVSVNYKNIDEDSNSNRDRHKVVLSKIANEQTKWSLEVYRKMSFYNFQLQAQNNCETKCNDYDY